MGHCAMIRCGRCDYKIFLEYEGKSAKRMQQLRARDADFSAVDDLEVDGVYELWLKIIARQMQKAAAKAQVEKAFL